MHQFLVAFDQTLNTLFGGRADETISARAYRLGHESRGWRVARSAIDTLFFWQPDHCLGAYVAEFERRQLPSHYRHPDGGEVAFIPAEK